MSLRSWECPYGTDAGPLGAGGLPCVVFGPGDIAQAHTKDEWVELDQVHRAAEAYYQMAPVWVSRRAADAQRNRLGIVRGEGKSRGDSSGALRRRTSVVVAQKTSRMKWWPW